MPPTSPTVAPPRRPRRNLVAVTLFVAISIACATRVGVLWSSSREDPRALSPDRGGWSPEFPAFIGDVRNATRNGDSIALVLPPMNWETYKYAYYRASYFLAGREVLPVSATQENLARAHYVAAWLAPPPQGWRPVLHAHHGTLLVR